jgi:hypothetical protein
MALFGQGKLENQIDAMAFVAREEKATRKQ